MRGRHTAAAPDDAFVSRFVRDFFEREVLFESTRGAAEPPPYVEACAR